MKKGVVLCSGGLDSTITMAMAKSQGFEIYALSFDYGQRHRVELESAIKVSQALNVREHLIMKIDMRAIGGSALTGSSQVPKNRSREEISGNIPITYVPARNTVFLSLALAWAEALEAEDIFIGVNALDYSGYPDCRPEYIEAFQTMANLATKAGVEGRMKLIIHTPLISCTKAAIIKKGLELGIDFSLTHSCYDPSEEGASCGRCDSCQLRLKGFAQAGLSDPVRYLN
ncbi:MAG: 7-cyano-7-deazaguanine synthase QueC [Candidatus Tectomicrobia bacterium]|uniref:7-cyano-7-deazaguanine synthase n=1 Tax=Tectimicrobiota bacterium TaxID=2528274 RepID=A0A933GMP8_UNCTE|nr:7-cyano-7-deazaguanine synthase QueC [Candidatus Tectomicrobia bacterium]